MPVTAETSTAAVTPSTAGTPETLDTHAAEGKFTDWDSSNSRGISQSRDSRDVIRRKNSGNSKVDSSTRGNGKISDPRTAGPQHCWTNHTANKFGLIYSLKRISQNSFPNFTYIFPKSFMIFCQELLDPKRNYKNQIRT